MTLNILTTEISNGKPCEQNVYNFQHFKGRIILRWIFRKWEGVVGTGWSWLKIGTDGGHL
jgi:hypothetical protein